jgi:hypothetical protein
LVTATNPDHGDHDLLVVVELDPLDDRTVRGQQPTPYPDTGHVVLRLFVSVPRQLRNLVVRIGSPSGVVVAGQ